jgi:hypothetical protein
LESLIIITLHLYSSIYAILLYTRKGPRARPYEVE